MVSKKTHYPMLAMLNAQQIASELVAMVEDVGIDNFDDKVLVQSKLYQLGLEDKMASISSFFSSSICLNRKGLTEREIAVFYKTLRHLMANYYALFSKSVLGDKVTLNNQITIRHDELCEGDLFVWSDQIMYLKGRNTYLLSGDLHYSKFVFNFEGEPCYHLGKVEV